MKNLSSLVYLAFAACLLAACDKELPAPSNANAPAGQAEHARMALCNNYSYMSKSGLVQVGAPSGQEIIIAFKPGLSQAKKQALLSKSPYFSQFLGTMNSITGDVLTFVLLKPGTTCENVETLRTQLNSRAEVKMVLLSYEQAGITGIQQYFNGILVTLKNPADQAFLTNFAKRYKTPVVSSPNGTTQNFYVLQVTKTSAADIFGITGALNTNTKVALAEIDSPIHALRNARNNPIALQPLSAQ